MQKFKNTKNKNTKIQKFQKYNRFAPTQAMFQVKSIYEGEAGVFGEHHHHVCSLASRSLPWINWSVNHDDS